MFHTITDTMQARMEHLEQIDIRDRTDGTPRKSRLRQVPPETGKLLAIMLTGAPAGSIIEIGTSAGYSTVWLALACREVGRKLTTFEIDEAKVVLAKETFAQTGVADVIELIHGDALDHLASMKEIAFCFLDAEKEVYADCYEAVIPNMVRGGLLVADNATNHLDVLEPMINRALEDDRVDAVVAPMQNGLLVCRKL